MDKAVGEGLSDMVTFEQRPEWREEARPADAWEKSKAEVKTSAKALCWEFG